MVTKRYLELSTVLVVDLCVGELSIFATQTHTSVDETQTHMKRRCTQSTEGTAHKCWWNAPHTKRKTVDTTQTKSTIAVEMNEQWWKWMGTVEIQWHWWRRECEGITHKCWQNKDRKQECRTVQIEWERQ